MTEDGILQLIALADEWERQANDLEGNPPKGVGLLSPKGPIPKRLDAHELRSMIARLPRAKKPRNFAPSPINAEDLRFGRFMIGGRAVIMDNAPSDFSALTTYDLIRRTD